MKRMSSCSDVQQRAEQLMLEEFSRKLGIELAQKTIPIGNAKVTVDGFREDGNRVTLVEVWAHVGKVRPAQRHKVLGDMLKLALVGTYLKRSRHDIAVKSYIVFADKIAANVVSGETWASMAAQVFDISTEVLELPNEEIDKIKEAQRKQDIRNPDEYDSESAEVDAPVIL